MFDRAILHMDLDAFFVSVECLKNSNLLGKPLIIGGMSSRGVVSTCSYEARRFGVHSAMPMKMALRLCPQAIVLRGDMDSYSYYSHMVTEVISEQAPLMEKASIDEFYVDLSGMDRYFGCAKWSTELRTRITKETGLPISYGLSTSKMISKMGTNEAKPNGCKTVDKGTEKGFIAPMAVKKIPGVGPQMHRKLSFMGVRTIRVLSEIPVRLLEREFGQHGRSLSQRANAIDPTPVVPYSEAKSISKERTFMEDTLDIRMIRDLLRDMCDKLAYELRTKQKLTSCVTVKIRYADFNTFTKQKRVGFTAHDRQLSEHALQLFDSLYERRQLIRLVGVKFSRLVSGNYQINLFEDSLEEIRLLQQMDRIRNRFGTDKIGWASALAR